MGFTISCFVKMTVHRRARESILAFAFHLLVCYRGIIIMELFVPTCHPTAGIFMAWLLDFYGININNSHSQSRISLVHSTFVYLLHFSFTPSAPDVMSRILLVTRRHARTQRNKISRFKVICKIVCEFDLIVAGVGGRQVLFDTTAAPHSISRQSYRIHHSSSRRPQLFGSVTPT